MPVYDPSRPPPPAGMMQALSGQPTHSGGIPAPGMPSRPGMPPSGGQGGGITLGGVPANPGAPPMGGGMTAPGYPSGPAVTLDPATGAPGNGGFMGMMNNPSIPQNIRDFLTALQGWRDARPQDGTRDERQAWRAQRPGFNGMNGFGRNGAASVPGAVPAQGIAVGEPNPAAPGGMVGSSLAVGGMTPPTDPYGLPGY